MRLPPPFPLPTQRNVTQRKRKSLRVNRREKKHCRLFVPMRKAISFYSMLTVQTKRKRTKPRYNMKTRFSAYREPACLASAAYLRCSLMRSSKGRIRFTNRGNSIPLIGDHKQPITHASSFSRASSGDSRLLGTEDAEKILKRFNCSPVITRSELKLSLQGCSQSRVWVKRRAVSKYSG